MNDVKAIYEIHRLHEEKYNDGRAGELPEGDTRLFHARCESIVRQRFASLFHIPLSVKRLLERVMTENYFDH